MATSKLEQRMIALEKEVVDLKAEVASLAQSKDWSSTIGMFAGDEVMKQIDEAGRRIREKDRERARRGAARAGRRTRR